MREHGQPRPGQSDEKICETCGRPFSWRRRWARDWDRVRYCSARCRGGPGAADRAAEQAILDLLERRRAGATICPSEVARERWPGHWRDHMETVRSAARRLAGRGTIDITQDGRSVDPGTFRGPVRLRLRRR